MIIIVNSNKNLIWIKEFAVTCSLEKATSFWQYKIYDS